MPGIVAVINKKENLLACREIKYLFDDLVSRGQNSSALLQLEKDLLKLHKARQPLNKLFSKKYKPSSLVIGFAGLNVSHPSEISALIKNNLVLFHDGLLTNELVDETKFRVTTPSFSESLLDKIVELKEGTTDFESDLKGLLAHLKGSANCLLLDLKASVLYLFSNHGSLYFSETETDFCIASEAYLLRNSSAAAIQVLGVKAFKLPITLSATDLEQKVLFGYADSFPSASTQLDVLEYKLHNLKRCTKCILPETFPFIRFDTVGVCNYCHAYKPRNQPKDNTQFFKQMEAYRRKEGYECIVPFSGGRDSCAALHLIINELKLRPVTYTYDWGMVTDVGRRNIAIMCGELGVENIVVADNIEKKRKNIAMNFNAWLKNPDLGMINLLTAGDKHFFHYINKVKKETGVGLNLWGVNPLEVTHFKTGFLGIEPDFEKQKVYASGKLGQLRYHSKRFKQMLKSPGYFNSSLWDTYSGEYFRSFAEKKDYFHIFDYWQWDENEINTLLEGYGWETANDTPTTWRIGDGTAGIFNYIYYTLAGFTEHDTFRSNQIREGQISREQALKLVEIENVPCHDNLRWYLQSIGFDFVDTIKKINSIKRHHEGLY